MLSSFSHPEHATQSFISNDISECLLDAFPYIISFYPHHNPVGQLLYPFSDEKTNSHCHTRTNDLAKTEILVFQFHILFNPISPLIIPNSKYSNTCNLVKGYKFYVYLIFFSIPFFLSFDVFWSIKTVKLRYATTDQVLPS